MRESRRFILCLSLLLLAGLLLFGWTVHERSPWFGQTPIGISGWNTAGTALVASHWYLEGPLDLAFGMYWTPASIETPQEARELYASYPPGAVLPVYLLSLFSGSRATPELAMGWNLFLHLLTALLLGATVVRLAIGGGTQRTLALLFGIPPFLLYLFLPSPNYEHLMGYFADQAVMAPFAAFVLLEVLRWQRDETPRTLEASQFLVAFYGCLTDWLFYFLILTVAVVRLVRGGLAGGIRPFARNMVLLATPALCALLLFLLQLWHLGALDQLQDRLLFRSGIDASPSVLAMSGGEKGLGPLQTFFWQSHIPNGFGQIGKYLILLNSGAVLLFLLAGLAWRLRRRAFSPRVTDSGYLLCLLAAPPWLYLLAFPGHNNMILHFFAALKFAPLIAAGTFGAVPVGLALLINPPRYCGPLRAAIASIALMLAVIYSLAVTPARAALYEQIDPSNDLQEMGRFIGANTGYSDVVFSPVFEVRPKPPQRMYHAMKQVYRVETVDEMRQILQNATGKYRVMLLIESDVDINHLSTDLQRVIHMAESSVNSGEFRMYSFSGTALLDHPG
jgi:hypothetical protein